MLIIFFLFLTMIKVVNSQNSTGCNFEDGYCAWEFEGKWQKIMRSKAYILNVLNIPVKDSSLLNDIYKIAQHSDTEKMLISSPTIAQEGFYCLFMNVLLRGVKLRIRKVFSSLKSVYFDLESTKEKWMTVSFDLGFLSPLTKIILEFNFYDTYNTIVVVDDINLEFGRCKRKEIANLWPNLFHLFIDDINDNEKNNTSQFSTQKQMEDINYENSKSTEIITKDKNDVDETMKITPTTNQFSTQKIDSDGYVTKSKARVSTTKVVVNQEQLNNASLSTKQMENINYENSKSTEIITKDKNDVDKTMKITPTTTFSPPTTSTETTISMETKKITSKSIFATTMLRTLFTTHIVPSDLTTLAAVVPDAKETNSSTESTNKLAVEYWIAIICGGILTVVFAVFLVRKCVRRNKKKLDLEQHEAKDTSTKFPSNGNMGDSKAPKKIVYQHVDVHYEMNYVIETCAI